MPRRNTRTKKRTLKKRSRKQRGGGGDDTNGIRRVPGPAPFSPGPARTVAAPAITGAARAAPTKTPIRRAAARMFNMFGTSSENAAPAIGSSQVAVNASRSNEHKDAVKKLEEVYTNVLGYGDEDARVKVQGHITGSSINQNVPRFVRTFHNNPSIRSVGQFHRNFAGALNSALNSTPHIKITGVEGQLGQTLREAEEAGSSLAELDLESNFLGAAGAHDLAGVLPSLRALQSLDLSFNEIGDAGAQALFPTLPSSLQSLELVRNDIGVEGAQALAAKLPELTALKTLELAYNRIGTVGVQALFPALPSSLQSLNLINTHLDSADALVLAAALPHLTALTTLRLEFNNNLTPADMQIIRGAAPPTCVIRF